MLHVSAAKATVCCAAEKEFGCFYVDLGVLLLYYGYEYPQAFDLALDMHGCCAIFSQYIQGLDFVADHVSGLIDYHQIYIRSARLGGSPTNHRQSEYVIK